MLYPLAVLAIAASGLIGLSILLGRVIPDHYDDHARLSRVVSRRRY